MSDEATVVTKEEKRKNFAIKSAREVAYLGVSVALLAVGAFISLPIGEVPFTLQTLVVCLLGALLGWKRGLVAVAVYLLMGLVGIPVFAGFKSGMVALFGATGGYLFGFLFAVVISGLFKYFKIKNFRIRWVIYYLGMILGLAVCYAFGTAWFIIVYNGGQENAVSIGFALAKCVVPFILPDLCKLAVASFLAVRLEKYVR